MRLPCALLLFVTLPSCVLVKAPFRVAGAVVEGTTELGATAAKATARPFQKTPEEKAQEREEKKQKEAGKRKEEAEKQARREAEAQNAAARQQQQKQPASDYGNPAEPDYSPEGQRIPYRPAVTPDMLPPVQEVTPVPLPGGN